MGKTLGYEVCFNCRRVGLLYQDMLNNQFSSVLSLNSFFPMSANFGPDLDLGGLVALTQR